MSPRDRSVSHTVSSSPGFSLVEVMIALGLGLLLSIGVISIFGATSKSNKVQEQMARLQESARYAVTRMEEDLRHTSGLVCNNTGGMATMPTGGSEQQDQVRTPQIFSTVFTLPDTLSTLLPGTIAAPTPMKSNLFARGYECGASSCTPAVPTGTGAIPAIGTATGSRAGGADVLTVRYVNGPGWPVNEAGGSLGCTATPPKYFSSATVVADSADPSLTNFQNGDLAMLADCNSAYVFSADLTTKTFTPTSGKNVGNIACGSTSSDLRLINFSRDFLTISYYLKLIADPNPDAATTRKISTLVRRVNGGTAAPTRFAGTEEELVRGVERLDFRYGVENALGQVAYLTANQVDTGDTASGGTFACPPAAPGITPTSDKGCLWRAVKSIEVHMLLNSVDDLGLSTDEMAYRYSQDSTYTAGDPPKAPAATLVSGLASGKMMRREFTTVVAVRNYNP